MTGRPKAFTEHQDNQLLWRYQRGETQTELAVEHGVTRRTVWRAIQRARDRDNHA